MCNQKGQKQPTSHFFFELKMTQFFPVSIVKQKLLLFYAWLFWAIAFTVIRVRVVASSTTFLHKRKFIFKNCPLKSRKNVFSGYFWQYHYDYFYCTFIHCWQKKVSLNIEAIKVSQKRRKIIYLYKSVNINFCITFEILSKFQESSIEKFK